MLRTGLEGGWALVTGGTRGIGRATADAFAQMGAHVAVASRNAEDAARVASEVKSAHGVETLGLALDVVDASSVERAFATLDATAGRIDALACVAGYPLVAEWWDAPVTELPLARQADVYRRVWEVDVQGSRFCATAALPRMMSRGKGAIVLVSSTPALAGFKGTPYTEAKAALLGLTKDLAREYGPRGVRVNAVAPGNIATAWADGLAPEARDAGALEASLRRWGRAEEVASVIAWLCSDQSSFVTGQTVIVDGGTEMR